jgi:hypothetical protein
MKEMARDLVLWNLGMDDAEAGKLPAAGQGRDYYLGYYYSCALGDPSGVEQRAQGPDTIKLVESTG